MSRLALARGVAAALVVASLSGCTLPGYSLVEGRGGGAGAGAGGLGGDGGTGGGTAGSGGTAGGGGAALAPPDCGPGTTASFYDDFEDEDLEPFWNLYGSGEITEQQGTLTIAPQPNVGGDAYSGATAEAASLRECEISVRIREALAPEATGDTNLHYWLNDDDHVIMSLQLGTLRIQMVAMGVLAEEDVEDYDVMAEPYWRLREAGGVLFAETSADGRTFTPKATFETPGFIDNGTPGVSAGTWAADAAPGVVRYEDFNLLPR